MTKEKIGSFVFGIKFYQEDGKITCDIKSEQQSAPTEMVIMQMKAFLNQMESQYYKNFNENTNRMRFGGKK